ncbi:MAG TPA: carboxypeptidase-like regulatory domain-containing protein [Gemmatimonadaceae bacterium]|jgi:hypothetical protein
MSGRHLCCRVIVACTAVLLPHTVLAQQVDTVRGTVRSDSGVVLAGATVIVTMAPSRLSQQTVADSAGQFAVRFSQPTGDYLVYATAPGYETFRKRLTHPIPGPPLVVDIRLTSTVVRLKAMRSTAPPRPLPEFGGLTDPTAALHQPSGLAGAIAPENSGDLSALALTVPGISATSTGDLVAFGMANQVSQTINGMSLGVSQLPADLPAYTTIVTSPYDASVGGFGAARINVQMAQGSRVPTTFVRATAAEPVSTGAGHAGLPSTQPHSFDVGATANGPVGDYNLWYNTGVQVTRRAADGLSLFEAPSNALELSGVAPDSVARLEQIARGKSLLGGASESAFESEHVSYVARLDHYADPGRYHKLWNNAFSLTAVGDWTGAHTPGNSPLVAAGYGSKASEINAQLIGQWNHLTSGTASEMSLSLVGHRSRGTPLSNAPSAALDVISTLGDGSALAEQLRLGGNPTASKTSGDAAEAVETLQWYVGSSHKIKLYGRSSFESASTSQDMNTNGTFEFQSLNDFANDNASSFRRTLGGEDANALAWRGDVAVTDLWQATHNLQVSPGLRLEGNRWLGTPAVDSKVVADFGTSNSQVPNMIHLSPRLGFAWSYAPSREIATGTGALGRLYLPVEGVLSGGIGEFRSEMPANRLLGARSRTGLAMAPREIACFGADVPTPDWPAFVEAQSTIPRSCTVGASSPESESAPVVELFDRSFAPARSWRGNLQWGSSLGRLRYSANAELSYNVDQAGIRELNFTDAPRFLLSNEGGRPVFVSPASIDPATGVVSPTSARSTTDFADVIEDVSDRRSTAGLITLSLEPRFASSLLRVDYTLSRIRGTERGFDGSTFLSPSSLENGRSDFDVRHHILISAGHQLPAGLGLSLFWNIQSGIPYTPIVNADINGDGLANDRAFIFDPSRVPILAFADSLRALMGEVPSQSRKCLQAQLGRAAGLNSCEGPWTSTLNAALRSSMIHVFDDRQATIQLSVENVLGGIDQLLHNEEHLQGWGAVTAPNTILYTVRGFSPTSQAFDYSVNPRFGSTRTTESVQRAPFRISLSARIEVGQPKRHADFQRFLERAPIEHDFSAAPRDSVAASLADYIVTDGYVLLLRQRDSLLLTDKQERALEVLHADYRARALNLWRDAAAYILANRDHPDFGAIDERLDVAAAANWKLEREEVPRMLAVLTPAQQELATAMLDVIIKSDLRPPPLFRPF